MITMPHHHRSGPHGVGGHRVAVWTRLLAAGRVRPGPGSASWRINREVILVAAWSRAILLQLAHPSVAAGVDHHSAFRGSLSAGIGRLRSTVGAMLAITFGSTDEMIAAAAGINAIHDRVRGRVGPGEAAGYSAHDPELQRWVHVTLLDSLLGAHERLIGPLEPEVADAYCRESAIMEVLLGMPDDWLPRSRGHLDECVRTMLAGDSLRVTDAGRALARALLYPPRWRLVWPAFRAVQLLTIGTLPPALRVAYGFEWRDRDQRSLDRWTGFLRVTRRHAPRCLREWPSARRRPGPGWGTGSTIPPYATAEYATAAAGRIVTATSAARLRDPAGTH